MTESPEPGRTPEPTTAEKAARRRRLAEVFGEVLPEQTSDDTESPRPESSRDDDLLRQVPPHHGS